MCSVKFTSKRESREKFDQRAQVLSDFSACEANSHLIFVMLDPATRTAVVAHFRFAMTLDAGKDYSLCRSE